jgi:hypothetical protein
VGGRPFRTNRRLLAMSALMSASAYFRLLPPRPATCSSIASFTVLLCAALVLGDIYAAPLCFVPSNLYLENVGRFKADCFPFVGVGQFDSLGGR